MMTTLHKATQCLLNSSPLKGGELFSSASSVHFAQTLCGTLCTTLCNVPAKSAVANCWRVVGGLSGWVPQLKHAPSLKPLSRGQQELTAVRQPLDGAAKCLSLLLGYAERALVKRLVTAARGV